MELQGRSAIVTGGAGGLGAATVRRLVDQGMGVAIFDMAGDRAKELAGELGASEGGLVAGRWPVDRSDGACPVPAPTVDGLADAGQVAEGVARHGRALPGEPPGLSRRG